MYNHAHAIPFLLLILAVVYSSSGYQTLFRNVMVILGFSLGTILVWNYGH